MAFPGFPGGNGSSSFTAASAAAAFAAVVVFRRWWCLRCATVMAAAAKAAGADGPRVPGALSTRCGAWEHATEGNTPEGELFSDGATNNMAKEYNDFLRRKWRKQDKQMVLLWLKRF